MKAFKEEFPNPVLASGRDDYIESCFFKTVIEESDISVTGKDVNIPVKYELVCNGIQKLIESGDALTVVKAISSAAVYSELFRFPVGECKMCITIPNSAVKDRIILETAVIATHNIKQFSCPGEFNPLYFENETFEIRKGDILANEYSHIISLDDSDLGKNIESVFIVHQNDEQESDIVPNYDNDKIYIYLKSELYKLYSECEDAQTVTEVYEWNCCLSGFG